MLKSTPSSPLCLCLVGDFAPSPEMSRIEFEAGIFQGDLTLLNLEVPLCDESPALPKAGPSLRAKPSITEFLPKPLVCALANNHMMDYGQAGLDATLQALRESGISYVGAGHNTAQAKEPLVLEVNGWRVGIVARCDSQFGVATERRAGVMPFDSTLFSQITHLKNDCDVVIASVHGGAEMCPFPFPEWQDSLRSLIDAGADLVHGHHAHVPQGHESYKQGHIFYGMGNLLVPPASWRDDAHALWSLVARVQWEAGALRVSVSPVFIDAIEGGARVRFATSAESKECSEYLDVWNEVLADRQKLEALWQEVSLRMHRLYNAEWMNIKTGEENRWRFGTGNARRALGAWAGRNYTPSQPEFLLWHHLFVCEAHRSAFATALGVLGGELEDLRDDWTRQPQTVGCLGRATRARLTNVTFSLARSKMGQSSASSAPDSDASRSHQRRSCARHSSSHVVRERVAQPRIRFIRATGSVVE